MKRSFLRRAAVLSAVLLPMIPASHALAEPAEPAVAKTCPPFVAVIAAVMGVCALVALGAHIARLWKKD